MFSAHLPKGLPALVSFLTVLLLAVGPGCDQPSSPQDSNESSGSSTGDSSGGNPSTESGGESSRGTPRESAPPANEAQKTRLLQRASQAMAAGQHRQALMTLEQYLILDPENPQALLGLGQMYLKSVQDRDAHRALDCFQRAVATGDQAARMWQGRALLETGDISGAHRVLESFLTSTEETALPAAVTDGHICMAKVCLHRGELDPAGEHLDRAEDLIRRIRGRISPNQSSRLSLQYLSELTFEGHLTRAAWLVEKAAFERADTILDALLAQDPARDRVRDMVGQRLEKEGRAKEAEVQRRLASIIREIRATTLSAEPDREGLAKKFDELESLDPNLKLRDLIFARIAIRQGRLDDGLAHCDAVLKLDDDRMKIEAWSLKARIYEAKKDTDQVDACMIEIRKLRQQRGTVPEDG